MQIETSALLLPMLYITLCERLLNIHSDTFLDGLFILNLLFCSFAFTVQLILNLRLYLSVLNVKVLLMR